MSDPRSLLERESQRFIQPDGAYERLMQRRDRRRRNQRIAAGVVGIALFVAAIWIVVGGGLIDRAHTPAVTGPTGPKADESIGLIGLPPEGADPSLPAHEKLLASMFFGHTGGDFGMFDLYLYADGRVIWHWLRDPPGSGGRPDSGLVEQRLTPEGVELIRSEVLSTAPFDRDRHLALSSSYDLSTPFGGVEVRVDGRLVSLSWGIDNDGVETTPSAQLKQALDRLDTRVEDLAAWLPATAWAEQEPQAFVPSMYRVCVNPSLEAGYQQVERTRVLALLPQPAQDVIGGWETTRHEQIAGPPTVRWPSWCSRVPTEQARTLAEVLHIPTTFDPDIQDALTYHVVPEEPSHPIEDVLIVFSALLPHET